jgi:hypothetical protein
MNANNLNSTWSIASKSNLMVLNKSPVQAELTLTEECWTKIVYVVDNSDIRR